MFDPSISFGPKTPSHIQHLSILLSSLIWLDAFARALGLVVFTLPLADHLYVVSWLRICRNRGRIPGSLHWLLRTATIRVDVSLPLSPFKSGEQFYAMLRAFVFMRVVYSAVCVRQ